MSANDFILHILGSVEKWSPKIMPVCAERDLRQKKLAHVQLRLWGMPPRMVCSDSQRMNDWRIFRAKHSECLAQILHVKMAGGYTVGQDPLAKRMVADGQNLVMRDQKVVVVVGQQVAIGPG